MLVPPFEPGRESRDFLLKRPEELSIPLITEGVRLWRERQTAEPFQFTLNDETWWCGFARYDLGPEQSFWIAVLVPAQSLVGVNQST